MSSTSKIAEYEAHEQTFTYEHGGEFETLVRRVCTLKITARLAFTFYGGAPYQLARATSNGNQVADILHHHGGGCGTLLLVAALARPACRGSAGAGQLRFASRSCRAPMARTC